ncbi:pilus assembly protein CpaA [Marivita lacus]|uniref:Pilus assembly protein CpaA n=1 Tax=Marivita lacus TaxID=1323742 RepID=A0ABQ1KC95_9RHOB|nr:prepilin peptidase [Marivita lacus]GGB94953.1 pilus assembly protein CpaA [Marivita lacus]
MPNDFLVFALLWFIGCQLLAATSDAMRMRIPNLLILFLLAGYAVTVMLVRPEWASVASNVATGFAVLMGGMLLFARGWMGGGDVKLLAVSGLWLGPVATPALLLLTAIAGGVLTLVILACRTLGAHRLGGTRITGLHDPNGRVPYGIAIATAAIAVAFLRPDVLVSG